jgi:hypothetical protein
MLDCSAYKSTKAIAVYDSTLMRPVPYQTHYLDTSFGATHLFDPIYLL